MRNINVKLFITFIAISVLSSCANLIEEPEGLLTPDVFYSTEQDLRAGVIATYRPFMEYYLNAQGGMPAMGGDDVTTREGSNKEPYRGFDRFDANPSYDWLMMHTWEPLFRTVFHANAVINNYENVPESFTRDAIAAEAYFLRAWAYFRLTRTFGPVPLVTSTSATGEEPRTEVSEVYAQIIADLQFAEDALPGIWFGEPGRVTKWGAKSLLAKVYLTSAGWPLKNTANYSLAATKAKEVMDGSTHNLLPNFADLWDPANPNNTESILAVQACENCGDWGLSNRMPYSIGAEAEEGGWDDYYAEIEFFNEFPDGPRKDATFQTSFGTTPWENTSQGHPYYHKTRGFEVAKISSLNEYVIRLADVYLIYAEAQNKADGSPSAAAYDAVNEIRRRAAGVAGADPTVDLQAGLSGDDFHAAVVAERGWELCAEWERWFDLVRNQMVAEATSKRDFPNELPLNAAVDVNSEASFEPYYWAPIPLNEMLLRPDWVQNPCCR